MLFAVAAESLFIVFLTVFLFNHANPKGDGMEMVAVGVAMMFIFFPLSLPAFALAKQGRYLIVAAVLAGLADGGSLDEVAATLGLAPVTASNLCRNSLDKLHRQARSEGVLFASVGS